MKDLRKENCVEIYTPNDVPWEIWHVV